MNQLRKSMARDAQPIALVIFDAFDTLITPRIAPYLQYAEEARKVGLSVDDDRMKPAFRNAFKEMAIKHPIYGLNTGLPTADDWWLSLIEQSLLQSGVSSSALHDTMPTLGPAILKRFTTTEAYKYAEGVPDVLRKLHALRTDGRATLTMSLATNSDERILEACKELQLADFLALDVLLDPQREATNVDGSQRAHRKSVSGPTVSYDVGYEKPHANFFHAAVQRAFPTQTLEQQSRHTVTFNEMCQRTLYVGDHLFEDYFGAQRAGLQAVWLQRAQPWPSEHELEQAGQTADGIRALRSMLDVVDIVKQSWQPPSTDV